MRAALLAVLFATLAAGAEACPKGEKIRIALCGGAGTAEILLLPERLGALDRGGEGAVTVTGAYTGAGARLTGAGPKPVGVFIAAGAAVSLELGRMDGLLVVDAAGRARISTIADAALGGASYDLRSLPGRRAFARAAAEAGASALQSHLLIRDGALDLRPVDGAPRARRRLLIATRAGDLAIWESGEALTLFAAAAALMAEHAPLMALNLDMGSYDFCETAGQGDPRPCGMVGRGEELGRLSNLVRLTP